jgi:IclR family transcriptional regulator, blcABC operon repressor
MQDEESQADTHGRLSAKRVPAIERAVAVLRMVVRANRPVTLGEVSRSLGMPKSTTHGICQTLVGHGYLRRLNEGFVIGHAVMPLASAYLESTSIPSQFGSMWRELESSPNHPPKETVVLSALADQDVVYTAVRNASRLPTFLFTPGRQVPAHLCASGKAMLAWQPDDEIARLYGGRPMPKQTQHGPADLEQLLADLRIVRSSGYSVDQGCVDERLVGFGAPVFDSSASPVAGIGIVLLKSVATFAPEVHPRMVMDLAVRLTCRLRGRVSELP